MYSVTYTWTAATSTRVGKYFLTQSADYQNWSLSAITDKTQTSVTLYGYLNGLTYDVALYTQTSNGVGVPQKIITFSNNTSANHLSIDLGQAMNPNLQDDVNDRYVFASPFAMQFRWRPSADPSVTEYLVWQSTDTVNWSLSAIVPASQTSVNIGGFLLDTIYYLAVTSQNQNGYGQKSLIVPMELTNGIGQITYDLGQAPSAP